jgi:hypothetical protein
MVDLMDIYHVRVRRDPEDARFWLATVDGLDTLHPSARSLSTLRKHVLDVIVLAAELPDDADPDIDWTYETGDDETDAALLALRTRRASLEQELAQVTAKTEEYARDLVLRRHMPVREAAALLGISPARVGQLTSTPTSRRAAVNVPMSTSSIRAAAAAQSRSPKSTTAVVPNRGANR